MLCHTGALYAWNGGHIFRADLENLFPRITPQTTENKSERSANISSRKDRSRDYTIQLQTIQYRIRYQGKWRNHDSDHDRSLRLKHRNENKYVWGIESDVFIPSILQVCQESYNAASKYYKKAFQASPCSAWTYFDFKRDTLYLDLNCLER
jgi:hypothetical protein